MRLLLPVPCRYFALGIAVVLPVLLSGCIGRREALNVSNSLIQSSTEAAKSIQALHEAARTETNAHTQTRQAVQDLHAAWFNARVATARAQVDAAFQGTLRRISEEQAEAQLLLRNRRLEVHGNLDAELKRNLAPLQERVEALRQAARQVAVNAVNAPGDLRLRAESAEADRSYLAALGRKIEIDRDAWRDALKELDQAHGQALEQLAKAAKRHSEDARKAHARAHQDLDRLTHTPLALGGSPRLNSDTYEALVEYQEAVKDAGQAMKDYLVLNSFGKGSFLDIFLRSAGKGFIAAVPFIGDGKGVQWSEVKDSASGLLGDVAAAAKENLADAESTALDALRDMAKEGASGLESKLSAALNRLGAEALKKLNSANP